MYYRINHEIFSVGFHNNDVIKMVTTDVFSTTRVNTPIVAVKHKDGNFQTYNLLLELEYWVLSCMHTTSTRKNPFPCRVAFGIIPSFRYL
ncbi:hypothetical protein COJ41_00290 [Bacillus thuringiensis]|nr:hypothetical protein CN352_10120 [Bacillus thuringiensis]PFM26013.1 hypothetical protein COJ41_00290 [Bacillus thuringiensis]